MRAWTLTAGVVAFVAITGCAATALAQPAYGDESYNNNGDEAYANDGYSNDGDNGYSNDGNDGYSNDGYSNDGYSNDDSANNAGGDVSMDSFNSTLSPYGEWVDTGSYGRVWRPYSAVVGSDFRPYATRGHWVSTDYGWSFESDYDWGWATFHYGRWWNNPSYGWVWTPDTVWAPSWVSWRYGGGYVGWSPLPPRGVVVVERYSPSWCFVETRYLVHPRFYEHAAYGSRTNYIYNNTTYVNNQVRHGHARWYAGPPVTHIASAVGSPIRSIQVHPPNAGYIRPVHVATTGASYGRPPPGAGGGFGHGASAHQSPGYGQGAQQGYPQGNRAPPTYGSQGAWQRGQQNAPPSHVSSPPSQPAYENHGGHPGGNFGGGNSSGAYHAPPSSGGGFHQAGPSGGGFHAPPSSGGGFHQAGPSGGHGSSAPAPAPSNSHPAGPRTPGHNH